MPYVPGLNSGITDKVWLEQTGDASLIDPWVRTRVPSTSKAEISLSVEVSNEADREKTYLVKGSIEGTDIRFEQSVKMDARQTKTVDFTTRYYPQLAMDNPKLWWPNGMGEPHLYTMHIEVVDEAGRVSDSRDLRFGVKEYSYDTEAGVFHLSVNKKRVFVKGANWGMSEYMLRCRGEEYRLKIRLHQQMHFNMIRNWLGSVTDDEFYQYYYFGSNAGNAGPDRYLRMIKDYFGEATSAEDLCIKGQLLSLESNKAMYEGWLDHIWNDASGILTWMGQSAYPSMVWQTYDYYYDLTGAYRLMLVDREKGGQILPAIFTDNYFTLRPGETKTVEIEVDSALLEKGYQVVAKTYQSK